MSSECVFVRPLTPAERAIPSRLRPTPPPIYRTQPTAADRRLARALLDALDEESRAWYRVAGMGRR